MKQEPPTRTIILEGYKLPQFLIHFENVIGEFWLYPVLPTQQYIKMYWDKNKDTFPADKETTLWIEGAIKNPARNLSIPQFSALFSKNRFLTKEGGADSFFETVRKRMADMGTLTANINRKLNETDKLQLVFETLSTAPLPKIYDKAIKAIDTKTAGTPQELMYLDILDSAMDEFAGLLERNIGKNYIGLYEIHFFKALYRKQKLFANRIFAYDLPRIINCDDTNLDKILTSLFVLGWGFELEGKHFKKNSLEIRMLAERFLKLYLAALAAKIIYRRVDEAEKKQAQRKPCEEITFTDLTYQDDAGNSVFAEKLELGLIDDEPSPSEQAIHKEAFNEIVSKLSPQQQLISKLLEQGYRQADIARRLKVSEPAISKAVKGIGKKLKT